jgi:hypothetical protein
MVATVWRTQAGSNLQASKKLHSLFDSSIIKRKKFSSSAEKLK